MNEKKKSPRVKSLLLEILRLSGVSRTELCARLQMSESCFCRYASGEYRLRLDMLPHLRRAAGISSEDMFNLVKHFYGA